MIQTFTFKFLLAAMLAVITMLGFTGVVSATHGGAHAEPQQAVCKGAKDLRFEDINNPGGNRNAACEDSGSANQEGINDLIATIINVFSVIVGIVAVIMIIWGGFKFITSGGDSGRVASARQTILYAIIGLIIVALAQFIVRFVLSTSTGTVSG